MSRTLIDLTGKKFGKLLVKKRFGHMQRSTKQPAWLCECECGKTCIVQGSNLRYGVTRSCGCLIGKTQPGHRMTHSKTYNSWRGMIERCTNPKNSHFKSYGERGVDVCEAWKKFENFYADMGDRPEGHSLDRIDNDAGYFKENCRWALPREQSRNTTRSVKITHKGETKCLVDWSKTLGLTPCALRIRIKRWGVEKAMTIPKGGRLLDYIDPTTL